MKKLLILLFPVYSFSQTKGNFAIGGNYLQGNYNSFMFDARGTIQNDSSKFVWNISPSMSAIYSNSVILKRDYYSSSSIEHRFYKKFKFLLFNEFENSYNRKIYFRSNMGVGISYSFINNKKYKFSVSEALLPEYVKLFSTEFSVLRSSTKLKFIYTNSNFSFSTITLLQPAIIGQNKYIKSFSFRTINLIEEKINKCFSIGIGFDYSLQTYVIAPFKPFDSRQYFYIKYNF